MSMERGQVLALGCVTMLILALSTMLSFSVAHSVHERIRLQSYADASAYSMAVVEARAMNYIAYSNRAIAATFVSMATAHAYVAAANSAASGPLTGIMAMGVAIAGETALGCYFPNFSHCPCILRIVPRIVKYALEIPKVMLDSMSSIEKPLNEAVEGFVKMIQSIHESQRAAVESAGKLIEQDILKKSGAPAAKAETNAFARFNKKQFACALESSPLDGDCDDVAASSKDDRKKIMANVVNASRPSFTAGNSKQHLSSLGSNNPVYHEDYVKKFIKDIPDPQVPGILSLSISAFMADGASVGSCLFTPGKSAKGDAICANASHSMFFPLVIHTPGFGQGIPAVIGSGDGDSYHGVLPFQHSGKDHSKFKKMFKNDSCNDQTICFINYRMGSKDNNWGQPLVFFLASQDLHSRSSENNSNTKHLPWDLNERGQVSIRHGARGTGKLLMRPQNPAYAASQALVYFHRINAWRAPPNLFEPYWRAKLHPFKQEDFNKLVEKGPL